MIIYSLQKNFFKIEAVLIVLANPIYHAHESFVLLIIYKPQQNIHQNNITVQFYDEQLKNVLSIVEPNLFDANIQECPYRDPHESI